ncbi:hypothetical protein Pla111_23550 [Botrimarina hoheduenensis]|uniref:PEP-CTERM protein-sorting domain-containing protein n=1 Tax=Botrimarina hoheduenensis TaxID=2528000 RepID=A0A5C5VY99_9BACT|nr:hypothetical protein Pla111_23550 [Botrimarina hoheduenensis]
MPAQISRSALQLASRLRLLMTFSFFLAASFLQAQVIQTLGPVGGGTRLTGYQSCLTIPFSVGRFSRRIACCLPVSTDRRSFRTANDINDNNWVTGTGILNGQTHGYRMRVSHVPEPSALVPALLTLAMATVRRSYAVNYAHRF